VVLEADWLNRMPSLQPITDARSRPKPTRAFAVQRLELVEAAAIEEAGDDLADRAADAGR
jgi:hypothetical protein